MKEAIIALLQQRMDKCTTEQFWAVASVTAADAFVVVSHKDMAMVPPSLVLVVLTLASLYAVFFVIQRHRHYYRYRDDMAVLLAGEPDVPEFLKHEPRRNSLNTLSGVIFYVFWILSACILCYLVILRA